MEGFARMDGHIPPDRHVDARSSLRPIIDASPDRPFVVAQLGQSLDGRIATVTGESKWINRSCALDHLHGLRAAVDAVVVGVGTVVADDPMLTVRRVPGHHPARIVIDPSGRMPTGPHCMEDNGARRFVIRTAAAATPDGADEILLSATDGKIAPHDILNALFARGMRRILIEGGATTISAFLQAGALDRLHVLVAPLIIGSGKNGLTLSPIERLNMAIRPKTHIHLLDDGDVLFDCDLRNPTVGLPHGD
jgi:diaminohydroxyphosphoribosylaminopyrimidine deaminase/5-amino-6-(5-phosphoribosylamino)uracil reductase